MSKHINRLIVLVYIMVLSITNSANALSQHPFNVDAKAAVLMDAKTGDILFAQDINTPIPPASFTKLATLYLVFEALHNNIISLHDSVLVSKKAWQTQGSKMFIEVNKRVSIEDLIKGIAVVSGNDACVALAEYLHGDINPFIMTMNAKIKELGLTNSHFSTPHGLPKPDQYTTAFDMATLAKHYIQNFPEALKYHALKEFTYNNIKQFNRNRLLWLDDDVDGLKTGHTEKAGYHLLATAQKDGMRLISVVMGCKSEAIREAEAYRLLTYGFRNFTNVKLFDAGQILTTAKVWKGASKNISLMASGDGVFSVQKAIAPTLTYRLQFSLPIVAPIADGQCLGKVLIVDGKSENVIKEIPLIAATAVPKGSFIRQGFHTLLLSLHYKPLQPWIYLGAGAALIILTLIFLTRKKRK